MHWLLILVHNFSPLNCHKKPHVYDNIKYCLEQIFIYKINSIYLMAITDETTTIS